ncbi:M23 family metallopeptidase [Virgisporangium aliadipatigenens]|nr:M23 family metallopeptidase [Virgisporangium aliadipatigenens]
MEELREQRGRYRGRRRVPCAPRSRYAAVMTTAFVGAGVVALVSGTMMPESQQPSDLALVDANAAVDADRAKTLAGDRASRDNGRQGAGVGASADQANSNRYVLPLAPGQYVVTSQYGHTEMAGAKGIDLDARHGTTYHAVAGGTVKLARWNGGLGYCIIIDHGNGVQSVYGHSSELLVTEGQIVEAGQAIGKVGNSGYAFTPHLRLEIRVNEKQVDPLAWLKDKEADATGQKDPLAA